MKIRKRKIIIFSVLLIFAISISFFIYASNKSNKEDPKRAMFVKSFIFEKGVLKY